MRLSLSLGAWWPGGKSSSSSLSFCHHATEAFTRACIYQASQSAILVLSAENSWHLLLLSNLSINQVIRFLKAKLLSQLFKTAREVSQVVRSCQYGLVMLLRRQRHANLSGEDSEEECSSNVWWRALNQNYIYSVFQKEHLHYKRSS